MRGLNIGLYGKIPDSTLHQLSSNSPGGVLFPKLEWLRWDVYETSMALTSFPLFLSPHLKRITLYGPGLSDISLDQLAGLVQIIPFLPTSLEDLTVLCGMEEEPTLKDAISSFIYQCGPSLRRFHSCVTLSEAAVHHLMRLPNLHFWGTGQGPPRAVPPSLSPPLEELCLDKQAALPWLHLLASQKKGALQDCSTQTPSYADIRETLRSLFCPEDTIINSTFLSSVLRFRNLVALHVCNQCYGVGGCFFRLTDDDVEEIAATLPRLESLQLGTPCDSNSCHTTVASLLSISIHCPGLTVLETHFNTLTIVDDMKRLLHGGSGRGNAKCKLRNLAIGYMSLEVRGEDIETIVVGLKVVFPYLVDFKGFTVRWHRLGSKLRDAFDVNAALPVL